jgi:toxin ParE1/3/4
MPHIIDKRPIAKIDIVENAVYLAEKNPDAADRFLTALEETLELIATNPRMGSKRLEHLDKTVKLRVFPVNDFKNYLIFYTPIKNGLEMIRLLHASMDSEARFK